MSHEALTQHIATVLKPWLNDERVVDAIVRYVASYNPEEAEALRQAERDWLKKYAKAWFDFHLPDWVVFPGASLPALERKAPKLTHRRAKSYISRRPRA